MGAITEDGQQSASSNIVACDPRDNYRIDDLESGDETDEENKPKRTIPGWARNKVGMYLLIIITCSVCLNLTVELSEALTRLLLIHLNHTNLSEGRYKLTTN